MSEQLEGAALFDAAAKAIGWLDAMPEPWLFDAQWLLVPAMLGWLRGLGMVRIDDQSDGTVWTCLTGRRNCQVVGPDLPTALARLVVRVAEIEGGKP